MPKEVSEDCGKCKFFYEWSDSQVCRRYPPQIYNGDGAESFPEVGIEEWCGEFVKKINDVQKIFKGINISPKALGEDQPVDLRSKSLTEDQIFRG